MVEAPACGVLSRREMQVLLLLADGLDVRDIAKRLTLAIATVRTHLSRILSKLSVHTQTQAVVVAYKSGWCHGAPLDRTAPSRTDTGGFDLDLVTNGRRLASRL